MENKQEITWDRICEQVGKPRIDRTPRDIFGQPLNPQKPTLDAMAWYAAVPSVGPVAVPRWLTTDGDNGT